MYLRRHHSSSIISFLTRRAVRPCVGCVPIHGSVRHGTDLKHFSWKKVPNVQDGSEWEACCELCGTTGKCQTWESDPTSGCTLKYGTPEEEHAESDAVVSGKRPSTGISFDSGLHRPTKLFVASHPDDDTIFFWRATCKRLPQGLFQRMFLIIM